MSLTAAEITELTSESAPHKILNEWLALYFDGNTHAVGSNDPIRFPKANRAFGQGAPAQPLHKFETEVDAEIRVLIFPRTEENDRIAPGVTLITDKVTLNFWVSAKAPGAGQSEYLARQIGELLKAILVNPDTRFALAEKGITHLNQVRCSPNVEGKDYHKRLVSCTANLQYTIAFNGATVPTPSADEQGLLFYNEAPLLVGEYLIGGYQWSVGAKLISVAGTAWPPQVSPVVLGLEVGGNLSAVTLTIPVGTPNVDTPIATLSLDNYNVNPGQVVRWKVLSAPALEDSAWHLTLTVQAQPQ